MWQTKIKLQEAQHAFSHQDKLLSLGSCFADEMGHRLKELYFEILINPFGVLYNPQSLAKTVSIISGQETWDKESIFQHQHVWRHFDFHSRLSNPDQLEFIKSVECQIQQSKIALKECKLLILTFGTSFVWEHIGRGVVGNCHKLPSHQFSRRMLTIEEINQALEGILEAVNGINKEAKILFTVSPVRHIRDGLVDNNWSKARLLDCCRTVADTHQQVFYFPSYEILMDELRNYRFYKKDMIHPSNEATDYIFDLFLKHYFSQTPERLIDSIKKLNKRLKHRPHNLDEQLQKEFNQKTENMFTTIKKEFGVQLKR